MTEFVTSNILKVTMEFRLPDGSTLVRTLEGAEAAAWNQSIGNMCVLAHVHGMNPDWSKFLWKEEVIPQP